MFSLKICNGFSNPCLHISKYKKKWFSMSEDENKIDS